jgi:hypothetical protein
MHAYVLMRNHYHLALETPQPNLGLGMHWLQTTMSVRFNRRRKENGHLFQGRYKSLVVENTTALTRVVDYIHLNPVRARVISPDQVGNYRWSSLAEMKSASRPPGLEVARWLPHLPEDWQDTPEGLRAYLEYLIELGGSETRQHKAGLTELSRGWAIGTSGWMQALAKEHASLGLAVGLPREERAAWAEDRWQACLEEELQQLGKTKADLVTGPRKQTWKLTLASVVRKRSGASHRWLAQALDLGQAATLRGYLHKFDGAAQPRNTEHGQTPC